MTTGSLLSNDGEMKRRLRAHDWSSTPLGALTDWPQSLRAATAMLVASGFPMIALWGPQLTQVYNDGYRTIMGAKHPAGLGQPTAACWPEVWHINKPIYDRVLAGETLTFEDKLYPISRNEELEDAWFTLSYSPLSDETDVIAGILVTLFETTNRILSDRRLAHKTLRQRQQFQQAPGFIAVLHGPMHIFDFVNDAYVRLAGGREFVGLTVREALPDLQGQGFYELLDKVYATGEQVIAEHVPIILQRSPGPPERRFVDFIYAPMRSETGDVTGIFVQGYDVTDAHLVREELRASEELNRRILASSNDCIKVLDLDGNLMFMSEGGQRVMEVADLDAIRGCPWIEFWVGEGHIEAKAAIGVAKDGGVGHFQGPANTVAGTPKWWDVQVTPILDVEGRPEKILAISRDITAARTAEMALLDLNASLELRVEERTQDVLAAENAMRQSQKMEAVGQLTGGVAHDFNNLLTIIRSSADFLRRPDLSDERKVRYLDAVSDTVDRAAKLTSQLLSFARRQALKPETFDVGTRLRNIGDMLDTLMGARIRITMDLPASPCFISADLSQFETAIVNLAVNARDAMDGDGTLTLRLRGNIPLPAIRAHAGSKPPFAEISLTDTGSGMTERDLSRIFEPFFTTKEVGKGTGLGLSQVFGFSKQSGGDVEVKSSLGKGSTFTLYLPEVDGKNLAVEEVRYEERLAPSGAGQHVLVVEDNIEVGRFSTQILQDLGYTTTWAANAEDALVLIGNTGAGFDIVFSDVVMPGMGGIELAKALRKLFPNLPIALTSGYSNDLAEQGELGFELLQKPYSVEDLSLVLQRVARKGSHAAPSA